MLNINLQQVLDFIVQYKHECTASTTKYIWECTLEEGTGTFLFGNCGPAMNGALVNDFGCFASRLHHHTTTDCIEWIWHNTSYSCYYLSDGPWNVDWCVLWIWQHTTSSIVETKVCGTVDDDTYSIWKYRNCMRTFAIRVCKEKVYMNLKLMHESIGNAYLVQIHRNHGTNHPHRRIWMSCSNNHQDRWIHELQPCQHQRLNVYGRNQVGRRSTMMWLQQHHQMPSYQGNNVQIEYFYQHRPRRLACTCPWTQSSKLVLGSIWWHWPSYHARMRQYLVPLEYEWSNQQYPCNVGQQKFASRCVGLAKAI